MTTGAIGRIEQRRASPSWSTVVAIAAALGVSLVDLAELIEANSPVRRDR
jgi:transcriptional regulator with XRE-family HTH domain